MSRHVIVVEDAAHVRQGHFPIECANLAEGLAEAGCSVELLTRRGWSGDGRPGPHPFTVTEMSPALQRLYRMSEAMSTRSASARTGFARRVCKEGGQIVRSGACALAVRSALRRSPAGTDVISECFELRPILAAAFNGNGRFLHHTFFPPPATGSPSTAAGRLLDHLARRAEARRRRRGGGMRVGVHGEENRAAWAQRTPYLAPVVLQHAIDRGEPRVDDARASFGIASDTKVALVFGAAHGEKDLDPVWRAFADLPGWTLLVVGGVARLHEAWAATHDGPPAITVGGFVDAATRARAFSAADLVVLSFRPGHAANSGVLTNAIGFGLPVVCSEGSAVASEVERHRLGTTFVAGDASSLAAAVRTAPTSIAPGDLAVARGRSSPVGVARAHLDALDEIGARPPGQTGRK